ncbi:MAG: transposase [Deltaproteobacteria bacterium]|nr:transposase [Deltaproteobacteria bacterium]
MPRSLPPAIAIVLRQSRWSPADAHRVLDAVAATGRSFPEVARQYHVDVQRLYAWRRRLASSAVDPVDSVDAVQSLVELRVPEAVTPPATARYEIQLPTGEILRVEGAVDPTSIGALLAVLRSGRAC